MTIYVLWRNKKNIHLENQIYLELCWSSDKNQINPYLVTDQFSSDVDNTRVVWFLY